MSSVKHLQSFDAKEVPDDDYAAQHPHWELLMHFITTWVHERVYLSVTVLNDGLFTWSRKDHSRTTQVGCRRPCHAIVTIDMEDRLIELQFGHHGLCDYVDQFKLNVFFRQPPCQCFQAIGTFKALFDLLTLTVCMKAPVEEVSYAFAASVKAYEIIPDPVPGAYPQSYIIVHE